MKSPLKTPPVSRELVEWLESIFRDRLPDQPIAHEQFCVAVGQQQVIRKLRHTMDVQSHNVLENP